MLRKFFYSSLFLFSSATFLLTATAVYADSAKLKWEGNNHWYKQYNKSLTWFSAKSECERFGGHLATVTSVQEQAFLDDNILDNSSRYLAIGGTDANNGNLRWLTGETWQYEGWGTREPDNNSGEDYVAMSARTSSTYYGWADVYGTTTLGGYLCEWSYNNHIDVGTVPDYSGNGIEETVTLFMPANSSNYYAKVKDSIGGNTLKTILFGSTNFAKPLAVDGIKDINGNGFPEIAVLAWYFDLNRPFVYVKDSQSGQLLKTIWYMTNDYNASDMVIYNDMNNNGTNEIGVVGSIGAFTMTEIRDSNTRNVVKRVFSN